MSKIDKVEKYFDNKSINYEFNSNKFPWSIIRKKENVFFLKIADKTKNKNILDLGSGSGYYTKLFSRFNKVHSVDISSYMLSKLPKKNIYPILADASEVNLNKKFDLILIAGLLEFVDNFAKVLKNADRHLKNNSFIIILFPRKNFFGKIYKLFHKKNGIDIKLFSKLEIENILLNLNFTIIKKKYIFPFSVSIIAKK
jgi:ubiquinone/menaquinone biosynthesis C-methylase UbiE